MALAALVPQFTKPFSIPAPMGGINAQDSLMDLPAGDCVAAINLIPTTYGMDVRKGSVEHARGFVPLHGATEVRSIIPYTGSVSAADRLFCATADGIYDISTSGTSFTNVFAWTYPYSTPKTGDCTFVIHDGVAGKFLLLCDEVYGYHTYQENATPASPGTWIAVPYGPTGIDGTANPQAFRQVTVWKQRVWFVDSTGGLAWYLDVGEIYGTPVSFSFGNKFPKGGVLKSLHSFTHDGGNGPDDYLVALSTAGDVAIYKGTDPASDFECVGIWDIGDLPEGRKLAASSGGDLYVLCGLGLISIAQLLRGADPGVTPAYITGKVTNLLRPLLQQRKTRRGWSVTPIPHEGILIITVPEIAGDTGEPIQLVMNLSTRAWTVLNGIQMRCVGVWHGAMYMGRPAADPAFGQVFVYSGGKDNVLLSAPTEGEAIDFFLLTSFRGDEAGGAFRRVQFIRPQFLSTGVPSYEAQARYDFDLRGAESITSPSTLTYISSWSSSWGDALWGGDTKSPNAEVQGAAGMGRYVAVALSGRAVYPTTLIGFTVMLDSGGLL